MRLTKSTSHAIRILIDCARAGDGLIKVAELSERLEITPQNVFKIVSHLAKAGLISAVRGRNGGVRLARGADQIRIGDVVRATEVTHVEIEESELGARGKGHGVNRVLDDALEAFIEVLDQHTIADMIKSQAPQPLKPSKRKGRMGSRAASLSSPRVRRALYGNS
jgi:Rrf2 family nitric oxide-sensitive transcriptional repressor